MGFIYCLVLFGRWASLILFGFVPAWYSEFDKGIGLWAGNDPEPAPHVSSSARITSLNAAAGFSVPVGTIITRCTLPGTVALTFDDGPYIYTSQVLDTLGNNNVPATFFINGDNQQNILTENSQALVRRMIAEGHQIGSHTWAHPDLVTLDRAAIVSQMRLLESALVQILGYYPTYMRPPYFSTNDLVLRTMGELGYHVVNADIDTLDWANNSEDGIQTSVQRFRDGLDAGGSISLSHDVQQWTANVLVQAMIDEVQNRGLRAVPVGECLDHPKNLWYRTS